MRRSHHTNSTPNTGAAEHQQQDRRSAGLYLDGRQQQPQHGRPEQQCTDDVQLRAGRRHRLPGLPRHPPPHQHQGHQPDGNVDAEDVAPAELGPEGGEDQPAEDGAGSAGHADGGAEVSERDAALAAGEQLLDQTPYSAGSEIPPRLPGSAGPRRRVRPSGPARPLRWPRRTRPVRRASGSAGRRCRRACHRRPGPTRSSARSPTPPIARSAAGASSPACIDGIATLTMVTSSSAMKPTTNVIGEDPPAMGVRPSLRLTHADTRTALERRLRNEVSASLSGR